MAKRVPGLPDNWQQYCVCLLLHLALPFLPLLLEWLFTANVEEKSLYLFVAMYAMAIGITSTSALAFSGTLLVGLLYCAAYGAATENAKNAGVLGGHVAVGVILTVVLVHAVERFNRHVVDRLSFLEFLKTPPDGHRVAGSPPDLRHPGVQP